MESTHSPAVSNSKHVHGMFAAAASAVAVSLMFNFWLSRVEKQNHGPPVVDRGGGRAMKAVAELEASTSANTEKGCRYHVILSPFTL